MLLAAVTRPSTAVGIANEDFENFTLHAILKDAKFLSLSCLWIGSGTEAHDIFKKAGHGIVEALHPSIWRKSSVHCRWWWLMNVCFNSVGRTSM